MKKSLFIFLTILFSFAILVGCAQQEASNDTLAGQPSDNDSDDSVEKVISVSLEHDASNFDPALVTSIADRQIAANIFDSLMFTDIETGELVEGLAESYTVSDDALTYTFKLREGVQFHKDYGEMTSEDVKFTLERILDPETNAANRSFLETVEEVNAPDEYTVEIKLNRNDPTLINNLSQYWTGIVSKKAVEEKGEEFNADPIGTGPFVFESWEPETATTLVKNPDWYRDEVKLDKVRLVPLNEPSTRYLSFESGDLDIIQVRDAQNLEKYENDDRFRIEREPAYMVRHIGMNLEEKPFDDIRVRKALMYGFNREAFIKEVVGGMSTAATGPIPPNVEGYEPDVTAYPYDPEKAKELLAEAGYADGLKIKLPAQNMDIFLEPSTVFQADMEKIGVEVDLQVVDPNEYLQKTREGKNPMFAIVNSQTAIPDFVLNRAFHSKNADGGDNFLNYRNDDVDAWLDELGTTLNETKRKELLSKIQKQIMEDVPSLFIDHIDHIYAVNNRVEGYHVTPTDSYQFYTVDVKE